MRALLFTLWLQADKSAAATLVLLEQLTAAQLETVQQGGARMINASLSGKSFSYELPPNWGAFDFTEMIRKAYKLISLHGINGGQMTDVELKGYVLDSKNEITDTLIARIAYNNTRR